MFWSLFSPRFQKNVFGIVKNIKNTIEIRQKISYNIVKNGQLDIIFH